MRGTDYQQSGMFSYISAERRASNDHRLRTIRLMVDGVLRQLGVRFDSICARSGATIHCVGEASARAASAGALHDPQRAHADGTASTTRRSSHDPQKIIKAHSKRRETCQKRAQSGRKPASGAPFLRPKTAERGEPDGEKRP